MKKNSRERTPELNVEILFFDTKAWLTDGKVRSLSPANRGFWIDLIAWTWFHGEDRHKIPKDITRIAEDLHISKARAEKIIDALQGGKYGPILEEHDDYYVIKRLRTEHKKLFTKSDKARHSAQVRWKTIPPEITECVDILFESVKENTPRKLVFTEGSKKLEQWKQKSAIAIDKMHRLDKISIQDIKGVIRWIKNDTARGDWTGWGSVVLSGDKLRKKYPKIVIQKERNPFNHHGGKDGKIAWPD